MKPRPDGGEKIAIVFYPFMGEYYAHLPDEPELGVGRGHCARKAQEALLMKIEQRRRGKAWMTI